MNELIKKYDYELSILKNFRSSNKYKLPIRYDKLMIDSGGFSLLSLPDSKMFRKYKEYIEKMKPDYCVNFDISCKPEKLKQYNLSVEQAQEISNENYWELVELLPIQPLPVIQGQGVEDYLNHIEMMRRDNIPLDAVCIGSLVGRDTEEIINIIEAVKKELPDTYIHGLGISIPKLKNEKLRNMINSADGHGYSFNVWYGDKKKNIKEKLHRWIRQYYRFRSSDLYTQLKLYL
jgi:hypothetical protein